MIPHRSSLVLATCLLTLSSSFPLELRQLSNVVSPFLSAASRVTSPLFETAAALNLPGSSILNPLLETAKQAATGQGLVEGVLGGLGGVLGEEQTFDYVVVGGGTAGIPIGVRLAQAGHSVAIIEAGIFYEIGKPVLGTTPFGAFIGVGGNPLDQIPTVDWGFTTEPSEGSGQRRVHYATGKALGGTSALNFMIHHRSTTGAYDKWAEEVGDESYRLKNLLPYFQKSVNFTGPNNQLRPSNVSTVEDPIDAGGSNGPVQVGYTNYVGTWSTWLERALIRLGLQRTDGFNSGSLLGYHYAQATIHTDTQSKSAADDYLKIVQDNQNLKIFTQTTAKQILFNGTTATGVRVNTLAALERTIHARKEVILSAGAFQSPQLLMVSGIGSRDTLERFKIPIVSALEGVGQNMWDHLILGPTQEVQFDTLSRVVHDPIALADALVEYLQVPPTGPLSSNIAEVIGWEKLPQKYRDTWSPSTLEAMAQFPPDWPEVEYTAASAYIGDFNFPLLQQPLDGKQYATIFGIFNAPTSRGNITISSADNAVPPVISPNWLSTAADEQVAISWFRRMREIWATPDLQSITVAQPDGTSEYFPGLATDTDKEILEVIKRSFMTSYHASGTCKMGKIEEDSMAVVDSSARVRGVKGLRVVDASIFPFLPPGHPQSTIYALAEKIAEGIIEGVKSL